MRHGDRRHPVEQALALREFGKQHHADQEEIDVGSLDDAAQRVSRRKQAEQDEGNGAGNSPHCLGQAEGAHQNAERSNCDDAPGCERRLRNDHARARVAVSGMKTAKKTSAATAIAASERNPVV